MTRRIHEQSALRVAKTGWAKAHHFPRERMRTCVAAVADESATAGAPPTGDGNIVRGDD
ncbi:hypothetical protein AB0M11_29685 [Streptomyces sp. NPDC051987]|uniref:hypothetical protein n=1 Tax=Streptomyces sp. NPDC051987 TaxID=3155808 RepID=UPI0034442E3E